MIDVKNLVEEASDVETETIFLLFRKSLGIFVLEDPTALRECEFKLVAVVCSLFRAENRGDLRHIEVTDAYELVIYLLLLCLELHLVWERLSFTSAANTEMLAEWLQTVL